MNPYQLFKMDNILGLALTSLSIIGILVSGAVWVIVLVNRVSVRTIGVERDIIDLKESTKSVPDFRDLQRDVVDLKEATKKLEEKTSFESLERITKKVMLQEMLYYILKKIEQQKKLGHLVKYCINYKN